MSSTTERGFGARLQRAQDLRNYLQGFSNYNPPRPQEGLALFTPFVASIITANSTETSLQQQYKIAIDSRQAAFRGGENSVMKLLAPIKGAVEAQYGKKSTEAVVINQIIKSMRATKLVKPPEEPGDAAQIKSISTSERSYGSMTQFFNDIISTLQQFIAYNPSNPNITVASLQSTSVLLSQYNSDVAQKVQALKFIRAQRLNLYKDLKDRVQRIKSYVKAEYGTTSTEYNLIKGLQI